MALVSRVTRDYRKVLGNFYSLLPVAGANDPVFIVGCGRSGTTILGVALSKHRKITYLNEPRKIWSTAYPVTDIWGSQGDVDGALALTEEDADKVSSRKLARLFRYETIITGRPVVVEKLPVNSFRLPFIHAIFPAARFVYLSRNGLEVARSIEVMCTRGKWFSANPYKWDQLSRLANLSEDTADLPAQCHSHYEKGLLEWRLSTESIRDFLVGMPAAACITITYDELVDSPVDTISRVLSFIGVGQDPDVTAFVESAITRKSGNRDVTTCSEKEAMIAGPLLQVSCC